MFKSRPISLTDEELRIIMSVDATKVDGSTGYFTVARTALGDGIFRGWKDNLFTITDGALAGSYRGADINYYYQGFVAAEYGAPRVLMNLLIVAHNVGEAFGFDSSSISRTDSAYTNFSKEIGQIPKGMKFAGAGYSFY